MFVDARTLPAGENIEADVCIVGGGPAGLAVATTLSGLGRRIVLAESGGFAPDPATQALNEGMVVGLNYRISESRPRYFGGAANDWAGNCRPLDPHDFPARSWLPHSGWPFLRSTLEPYYEKARVFCGVAKGDIEIAKLRAAGGFQVPWAEPLENALWQVSPAKPFGARFRPFLSNAPGLTVLLHANLVDLVDDDRGHTIALARFATLTGSHFSVAARSYVLACGGIENARLLLAMAKERHPTGLGNQHDLVGRFFTEHPEMPVGALLYNRPTAPDLRHVFSTTTEQWAEGFRLTDSIQQIRQIADAAFWPLRTANVTVSSDPRSYFRSVVQGISSWRLGPRPVGPRRKTLLTITFEQSPNPDSRITLCDGRDALGMRRACLDWRLNDTDRRTFATALKIMTHESARQGIGRFWLRSPLLGMDSCDPDSVRFDIPTRRASIAPNQLDTELRWGCHHMGTTRMHIDPRLGVVDSHARVHGLTNLYIAGSSIFPNVGVSNPTLTIMALAIKLAEYLKTNTG
jgi:choline dehydrogenase-like flavoprotein